MGQARFGNLPLRAARGGGQFLLGGERGADIGAGADAGLQQALGDEPIDGVDHRRSRHAEFLRQRPRGGHPVAGAEAA